MMHKALSLLTLVSLVTIRLAAAVCTVFDSDQDVLAHVGCEDLSKPVDDGGVICLPPTKYRSALDLNLRMIKLIRNDMKSTYGYHRYTLALRAELCP